VIIMLLQRLSVIDIKLVLIYLLYLKICWAIHKSRNKACFDKKVIKIHVELIMYACVFITYCAHNAFSLAVHIFPFVPLQVQGYDYRGPWRWYVG
jgi:hypothetical protein